MKSFSRLALLLCSLCLAPLASADALVDSMKADVENVVSLLEQNPESPPYAELKAVLDQRFSFYTISRRALGRGWSSFNEDQQKEFVELFTDLLVRTYASRYEGNADEVEVTWEDSIDLGSKKKEITTSVKLDNESVKVVYRLADLEGDWKIYDVLIEGVSLISNYREQFTSLLSRGSAEDVLKTLRDKSTNLESVGP
jgi:phospholipid transport system substrate-binding protein